MSDIATIADYLARRPTNGTYGLYVEITTAKRDEIVVTLRAMQGKEQESAATPAKLNSGPSYEGAGNPAAAQFPVSNGITVTADPPPPAALLQEVNILLTIKSPEWAGKKATVTELEAILSSPDDWWHPSIRPNGSLEAVLRDEAVLAVLRRCRDRIAADAHEERAAAAWIIEWMVAEKYSKPTAIDCVNSAKKHWRTLREQLADAEARAQGIGAARDTLFDAIKHGDEQHQAWLREKIDAHFAALAPDGGKDGG